MFSFGSVLHFAMARCRGNANAMSWTMSRVCAHCVCACLYVLHSTGCVCSVHVGVLVGKSSHAEHLSNAMTPGLVALCSMRWAVTLSS